jgi:hypothetical protein
MQQDQTIMYGLAAAVAVLISWVILSKRFQGSKMRKLIVLAVRPFSVFFMVMEGLLLVEDAFYTHSPLWVASYHAFGFILSWLWILGVIPPKPNEAQKGGPAE